MCIRDSRIIRGVEVSEASLGFDAMQNVITGEGHFIGEEQTLMAMERDYYYPQLSDRLEPDTWAGQGGEDIATRANRKVRELLANDDPGYIDAKVDQQLRGQFNILLEDH